MIGEEGFRSMGQEGNSENNDFLVSELCRIAGGLPSIQMVSSEKIGFNYMMINELTGGTNQIALSHIKDARSQLMSFRRLAGEDDSTTLAIAMVIHQSAMFMHFPDKNNVCPPEGKVIGGKGVVLAARSFSLGVDGLRRFFLTIGGGNVEVERVKDRIVYPLQINLIPQDNLRIWEFSAVNRDGQIMPFYKMQPGWRMRIRPVPEKENALVEPEAVRLLQRTVFSYMKQPRRIHNEGFSSIPHFSDRSFQVALASGAFNWEEDNRKMHIIFTTPTTPPLPTAPTF